MSREREHAQAVEADYALPIERDEYLGDVPPLVLRRRRPEPFVKCPDTGREPCAVVPAPERFEPDGHSSADLGAVTSESCDQARCRRRGLRDGPQERLTIG